MTDIEIAQAHEMKPITEIAAAAGIDEQHLELYGKYKAKVDYSILKEETHTQGKLVLGFRLGECMEEPDIPALYVFNAVYGSGATSKLFMNVREKLSLCYYASSAVEKYKGLMLVSSGIEFDKYETAKTAILGELEACRRGEISEAELESARRGILSALRAALDVPARLDDYYIGNAIAGGDSVEALIEKITRLSKDDLVRAAQRIRTDTVFFLEGVEA